MSFISREMSAVEPSYEGMRLIEMKWLQLSEIDKQLKKNPAREKPSSKEKIDEIANWIRNGKYSPYANEPPMVEFNEESQKYEILTGRTRYSAHVGVRETDMWVAVVKFDSDRARLKAQLAENQKHKDSNRFEQAYATDGDVVNVAKMLVQMYVDESMELTYELVDLVLKKDCGLTKKTERDAVSQEVFENFGVVSLVSNWTDAEAKTEVEQYAESDATVVTQLWRSGARTARVRSVENVFKAKTSPQDVVYLANMFTGTASEVHLNREAEVARFFEYKEFVLGMAAAMNDPLWTDPVFVTMPQVDGDLSVEDQMHV